MHFKDGFQDQNAERYMLDVRVRKLLEILRQEYYYSESFHPGQFSVIEGDYTYDEVQQIQGRPFNGTREHWGGPNQKVWFLQTFTIPESMRGKTLHYDCDLSTNSGWYWGAPQALIYVNGQIVSGMDVNHRFIELTNCAQPGAKYTIAISAFTDRFFYRGQVEMNMAIRALNSYAKELYYDVKVPFDVTEYLDKNDMRRIDILQHLNTALSLVDFRLPSGDAFDATLKEALAYMKTEFYEKYCGTEDCTVTCVGHTHIDTAWLWTLDHTRQKVVRTFSTVLDLLDRYKDMTFMSSQPQLYQFLKENYPEVYQRVAEKVKEGRWEAEGGMWVEADTNIPNGESLVRQIMYGKRFFRDEFGVDNRILWLPDVFGYSACLPQILKKSGIDYFMTTKISWNEYNKFPYDTFRWRGLDGSEVLAHFICSQHMGVSEKENLTTYNGFLDAPHVMGAWRRYQQKHLNRDVLLSYGFGDGGGGPNAEMVEQARRLSCGIPGSPRVKMGSARAYFEQLEKDVSVNKRLPVWSGELYFEYHRGTYTSVAKIKKNVRKSEILLQDTEFFSVLRDELCGGQQYPKAELSHAWHTLLLNEFHDIVPGSSIKEVYEDSDRQFAEIRQVGEEKLQTALAAISGQIPLQEPAIVVFNASSQERSDVAEWQTDWDTFEILDGERSLPWQRTTDGTVIFFAPHVPAKGYRTFTVRQTATAPVFPTVAADTSGAENIYFRLKFDQNGNITSLFDKKMNREMAVEDSPMNRLVAMEDVPPVDDAWNINAYINEKTWTVDALAGCSVVETGPVRSVIRLERSFMNSTICQDIVVYADLPRIDVKNRIDWKEKNILLKADFPFSANAVHAAFDVQFGNLERSTTNNTSWDFAQFEVCAHRWADLSEEGFGLSILNDCKYGYDVKDNHVRLTLLKSAVYPNPEADKELHTFTYSIYPHENGWKQAQTEEMAESLNRPLYTRPEEAHEGTLEDRFSLVSCGEKNVRVEAIKLAEDSDEIVIRLNEFHNKTTRVKLVFATPPKSLCQCDLMEENEIPLSYEGYTAQWEIKPFEICTLKARF